MRKDKKQIIGEELSDEQIRRHLDAEPPLGVARDFHTLERAYRGLRAQDFERFLQFFVAAGRDVNAADSRGRTLAAILATHANGTDYVAALARVGGH